jgi:LacI family transcriptional regulator
MKRPGTTPIGLLLDPGQAYYRGILAGLRAVCRPTWRYIPARSGTAGLERLRQAGVAGIIGAFHTRAQVTAARALGVPLVGVGGGPDGVITARNDEGAIGRAAAAILFGLGHRRLAVCAVDGPWAASRAAAFSLAGRRGGAEIQPAAPILRLPVYGELPDAGPLIAWVRRLRTPCCVFAVNDAAAVLVLDACQRAGRVVPAEVAVLGVDDDPDWCELVTPTLSSIRLDLAGIAAAAGQQLEALLTGRRPVTSTVRLPPRNWTARASTGAASALVPRVLAWMEANLDRPVGVPDACRDLDLARRTVEAAFARELGHGPAAELRRRRVARADQRIAEGVPVGEAARAAGFRRADRLAEARRSLDR